MATRKATRTTLLARQTQAPQVEHPSWTAKIAPEHASPVDSPVHGLQDRVSEAFYEDAPSQTAPAATLIYVVMASLGFWFGAAMLLRALIH